MKRTLFIVTLALVVICSMVLAQDNNETSRIERQHKQTTFMKDRLHQSEASILLSLQGESDQARQSAIQTLRDLEQLFPDYPFASMIEPLGTLLKNEKADPVARKLAALALDELHSDAGDTIIKDVADMCEDMGLQTLCKALLVRSSNKE